MLALVVDFPNFARLREDSSFAIADDGGFVPTPLPKLVGNLHVLVGNVVTQIVRTLLIEPSALCGALEVTRNDVPADPAFGQMIKGRHAAGKLKRRFVRKRPSNAKCQVFSYDSHCRYDKKWIIDRNLRCVAQRRFGRAAIHVIDSKNIGKKNAVKFTPLKNTRQLQPIFQILIGPRTVVRMPPHSRGLMGDAIHIECVQTNLLCHKPSKPEVLCPGRASGSLIHIKSLDWRL